MPLSAQFDTLGGPENIVLVEKSVPDPAPGEVQVRVHAAGLNRAELLYVAGQYLLQPPVPGAPLGVEGAGEVIAVGNGIETISEGDRVSILPMVDWAKCGVLAEVVNVPAEAVELIPNGITYEDAAAFWMAYATAYGMIVQKGEMPIDAIGKSAVITGASSSVGIASLQILKALNATSIATTRTSKKVGALNDAGADHVITTDTEDLVERVTEITKGRGVDLVCDSIIGPMIAPAADILVPEGNLVLMGFQSGEVPGLPFFPILSKGLAIKGFHLVWHLLNHPERRKAAVDFLMPLWASGEFKPLIAEIFEFEDVSAAYAHMASNDHVGKIVVRI
ncbi:MAG: zinc-dependent alcohol dehydrogenase family protein [Pseudomonadota bacterium]